MLKVSVDKNNKSNRNLGCSLLLVVFSNLSTLTSILHLEPNVPHARGSDWRSPAD